MDSDTLAEIFEQQAEWRTEKAAEYPDDKRNIEAASHLRSLALSAGSVDQAILTAAEELSEDAPDFEVWNEMLRREGVNAFHESAEAFLRSYISSRSTGAINAV